MKKYKVVFTSDAQKDLKELKRKAPTAIPKLVKLLEEISLHPRFGTGQCEQLRGYGGTVYSRRITKEHRIVYLIHDDIVEVIILSTYGHYE